MEQPLGMEDGSERVAGEFRRGSGNNQRPEDPERYVNNPELTKPETKNIKRICQLQGRSKQQKRKKGRLRRWDGVMTACCFGIATMRRRSACSWRASVSHESTEHVTLEPRWPQGRGGGEGNGTALRRAMLGQTRLWGRRRHRPAQTMTIEPRHRHRTDQTADADQIGHANTNQIRR